MTLRYLLAGAAVLLTASIYGGSAYALSENEIVRLHEMCVAGDRDACMHRDAAIHDHDHESEWRMHHPEWYR
jgi:hypothetical protein